MADDMYDDPYFDSFDDDVEPGDLEDLIDPEDAPAASAAPTAKSPAKTTTKKAAEKPAATAPPADDEVGPGPAPLAAPDDVDLDPALMSAIDDAMSGAVQAARRAGNLPAHKWLAANYAGSNNDGSAADKLADSAVAPLVAAARGYETVHEDNLDEATKRLNLPRKNSSQGKRIANSVTRGDLLIMPWFTSQDLAVAARRAKDPVPTTIQYRPSRPDLHPKTGKEMKYEFVAGSKTPIAVHPAFSQEWIDGAPVVLLAEGLLKGDSALTGYLLDAGVPAADLAWHGGDTTAARNRLAEILDTIPVEKRIVMFTIGGVDNWKNNAEWRDLELARRDVWVGIDGDVSSNPHVYRAANELWDFLTTKKKANVSLIAPTVQVSEGEKKIGIDDYLSHHGTWAGLTSMLASKLPTPPATDNLRRIGEFRVSEDGTCLEVCVPKPDPYNPDGPPVDGKWEFEYALGGRILSTVAQRVPTPLEIKTGILGEGANNDEAEAYCEVEISWREGEDKVHRHVVSGPAEILNYPPDQWVRHKAHLPAAVLRNPEWPPPRKLAEDWLRAIKAHKADEILDRVRWDSMGWVPVEGSVPAFVVGDQVIGDEDSPEVDIFPGITEAELAGANRFGVGDLMLGSFDDADYQAQVRADIEEVIETFILGGAWTDRKVASTVVAAALRPVLPIRPHSTMFLVGPPSKGKSWTAGLMMGFWSRRPGTFTSSSLPGSAKDTAASIETAVARAPIWVVDDLAPASSRQQSEQEQNKIGDLIRNVFNGAGKRRSTADMGSRKVHTPRSLLVVTAENEPQVASVRDRCITINIGWGALAKSSDPTDLVQELCQDKGSPARLTQAMIRYLRYWAKQMPDGWRDLYRETEDYLVAAQDRAAKHMRERGAKSGDVKRHADLAGDVAVSLFVLAKMAEHVGVRDEILDLISVNEMIGDIYDLVVTGHKAGKESTPGRSLVAAIQSVLFKGSAHVLDPTDVTAVPGGPNLGPMLGWQVSASGDSRARGITIGWLVTDKDDGEQYVYLDQRTAFSIAQREHPELVPPGQGSRSSWGSVIGEKLAAEHLLRSKGDGQRLNTARRRVGDADISGVPIKLQVLLNSGNLEDTEKRDVDDQ